MSQKKEKENTPRILKDQEGVPPGKKKRRVEVIDQRINRTQTLTKGPNCQEGNAS